MKELSSEHDLRIIPVLERPSSPVGLCQKDYGNQKKGQSQIAPTGEVKPGIEHGYQIRDAVVHRPYSSENAYAALLGSVNSDYNQRIGVRHNILAVVGQATTMIGPPRI